jgi:glycosyltransferase involved in cell wall biosynthesis
MNSANSGKPKRYVIITPVRDEARHIEETVKSVAQQTIVPLQWVIVDDGSTDGTGEMVDYFSAKWSWISAVHAPHQGPRANASRVMEAFYHGYPSVASFDWDFLVKLDGDLSLEPDYFERCFEEFQNDPLLGIGGGLIWSASCGTFKPDHCPLNHVRGATKIYRRTCWEAIGGLLRTPGWDTVDEVKAQMSGWKIRTFRDLKVLHFRPTGAAEGAWLNAVKDGRADYITGYHPLFMLLKCIKRMFQKPHVVGSCGLMYGFAGAYLHRTPQVDDKALIRYVRKQQMRRLLLQDSIWK